MAHAIVYLDEDVRDRLEVLMHDENFDELPEPLKILVRLFFMWEESDG